MGMVKKIIKFAGLLLAIVDTVALIVHQFMHPDMTRVRWLIEFWPVWLAWFVFMIIGCGLYLFGDHKRSESQ